MKKPKQSRREQQREAVIGTLTKYVLEAGLSETSLRQLADAAGVSNRMLLYYFDDKAEIMTSVLTEVANALAHELGTTLTVQAPLPPREAFVTLAQLVRGEELRPYMTVWIETVAAASRNQSPYPGIAASIADSFVEWMEARLDTPDPRERRAQAGMIVAMVDGLAMLSVCVSPARRRAVQAQMAAALGLEGR